MRRALILINLLVAVAIISHVAYSRAARTSDQIRFVQGEVEALKLQPQECAWERIGWTTDVDVAIRLSRKHHRPIFIMALQGDLDGRC